MKRLTVPLALAVLLLTASPAQAVVTQEMAMKNDFFDPATKAVNRGDKVLWTNAGSHSHTTTGDSPLNFWASPTVSSGKSFVTPLALTAAGTYPYHCNIHFGMKGKIQTPLTLTKVGRKITLTLSSAPADATHKFVVQRKNGSNFVTLASVTTTTYVFNAPAAGTFTFRSALQKNGTTATAPFFSVAKSITVT